MAEVSSYTIVAVDFPKSEANYKRLVDLADHYGADDWTGDLLGKTDWASEGDQITFRAYFASADRARKFMDIARQTP